MAEKGKSRGASAKSKPDKSRTPSRPPGRQSKKPSPKTPRQTSAQHTPSPDEVQKEPLEVGPILDDLLDRVLTECALAAAVRQRVPFTVSRARDAILFVAEWQFPARDEGDPDPEGDPDREEDPNREEDTDPERDGIWSEDEEPQTCPLDSRTPCLVPVDYEGSLSSEESSSEDLPEAAEAESPLVCPGEEPDAISVLAVPLSPDQVPSEDFPVKAEPESPLMRPGEVAGAAPVLAALLRPEVPAAAAAASPAQVPGADIDMLMPGPSRPEPPSAPRPLERGRRLSRDPRRGAILAQSPEKDRRLSRDTGSFGIFAPRPPEKDRRLSWAPGSFGIPAQPPERRRRLSWAPGSSGILAQAPDRSSQPSRPPQPRPAPQDAPQARAPVPTAPSEPPAQAPQVSHEGTAKVSHQVPPSPPPGPSRPPMQPRRPSRGTGVPRLGARRVAARRVFPEVKVVDVSSEPEWGRAGASRSRLVLSSAPQVSPGTGRPRKAEPQLCDPWLASARLAPGVTVRWGRSERRGPALPGHGGHEEAEEDDEAVKRADKELKPILAYPECRLSEYDE
ncbi:uncharacterized protein C2orf81 homolog [Sylvia borin]